MEDLESVADIVVLGIGNPSRGDDGVGWCVAQRLAQRVDTDRVMTGAVEELTPEWAEPLSQARMAIFVNAAATEPAGGVTIRDLAPTGPGTSVSHSLDPSQLLALAHHLHAHCPRAWLFTISGDDFSRKDHLSEDAEAACQEVVSTIDDMIIRALASLEERHCHA